jgi:leucyl/phenylalanyl-tRNA--protein transferase
MNPLDECKWTFPSPDDWDDDDVVAIGADLAPNTLLYAYAHGMFPMYVDQRRRTLGWWSPTQRGVIPLHELRVSRSTQQSARRFTCTINTDFVAVMQLCAQMRTDGNWIDAEFIQAYTELHALGHAHSVEVRNSHNELVGGLYGVRINGFFAGESMFHIEDNASKVALMHLVDLMKLDGMTLLDTQWCTDHLATLGCISLPRDQYLTLLQHAINQ